MRIAKKDGKKLNSYRPFCHGLFILNCIIKINNLAIFLGIEEHCLVGSLYSYANLAIRTVNMLHTKNSINIAIFIRKPPLL